MRQNENDLRRDAASQEMNTASSLVISASQLSGTDVPQVTVYAFTPLLIYDVHTVSETHPAGQLVTLTFHICVPARLFSRIFYWVLCSQAAGGGDRNAKRAYCHQIKRKSILWNAIIVIQPNSIKRE